MQNNIKEKTILIVSLINAGINALLAIMKIVIGKIGYSQALIADGIHSLSDLVSDALVFIAARASIQHPDKEHPYGHQRIETITTIIIGLILFFVAAAIFDEAIMRLLHHDFLKPTFSVVVVAVISIIANEWLFHYSKKQGDKIKSNLLISNAWHKRSDVLVSVIVLLSVIGSMIGWSWLDAIGAMIIAILIIKMAVQMIWHSTQELIDHGVDEATLERIKKTIKQVPGVRSIHQLRTRMHGQSILIDLHIIVDPFISVSEGHHIGEEVHLKLLQNIKNLNDVTVHIDPEDDEVARPSLHLPNREAVKKILAKRWENLPGYASIKKMTLHYLEGYLYIEIYLSQNEATQISADTLLAQYQSSIKDITYIASVVIHFMPK
ncbi:MAG: cation transporter [Gammaproteobacteria bacterium CG_4_10_14_0_8_um_filter_38_16]|nr:MAG: cation transporter [Gammaproteobacteria bacterium CG_4_10_14_0_8_um_filter_38_16]PJA02620.1 MAG: cation transporter [Gammaproteobacteria bacterium CG_4_10_14_0_2_um_filter_38_22]PJB11076.1 MAG: cation transporter [Gammaproteobacteria bacterium CG_4_9_14_3_um_filter_38_9]